jgi:iron(III) transport system permease protein
MQRRLGLALIVILLVTIGLLPILSMLIKSVMIEGHLSLEAYAGILTSSRQWTLMGHSFALSSLVTLLTVAVGLPLGVLLSKTDLPLRKTLGILFVIPLVIPPSIIAIAWSDLLGHGGLLASLAGSWVAEVSSPLLFGLPGCVAILFSVFLPIPMLLTMVSLRTINPRLEEAGRLIAPWRGVLAEITFPLILPGVLLSALLVFILTFGEFSVPNFLRYDVFPVETFTQFSAFYDFNAATAAAVPLAAVTLVLLVFEAVFLRDRTAQLRPSPDGDAVPLIELGPSRNGVAAAVAVAACVIVLAPILVLLIQSAGPAAYSEALGKAGGALVRSLIYAAIGATLLSILGFFTGYLIHTRALRCWRSVDSLTIFLFALPGTVIGIGLISLWNTPWTNIIYGTPMIIILGYLAKYTALTSRITATQLAQIPPSMEEAAQVAGAGWFHRMVLIVGPLARRGLIAGWLVAFVFSLRDTGITMLVYPAGHETLPVRIFTLMANGSPQLIAALCVLMILTTLVPPALVWLIPGLMTGKSVQ